MIHNYLDVIDADTSVMRELDANERGSPLKSSNSFLYP
jgi:hypothetical protein